MTPLDPASPRDGIASALLESAPDAMVLVNSAGAIAQINARTERMFGYPRGELLGQPVEMLLPERFRARHRSNQDRHLIEPADRPVEAWLLLCGVRKNGEEFPVEIGFSSLQVADEVLVSNWFRNVSERRRVERTLSARSLELEQVTHAKERANALERELLERRQAESALRQERDRAQRYLDTADVILLALDLDCRVTLINRKGCTLLGWTEAELLGRPWLEACVPTRAQPVVATTFQNLVGGADSSVLENPILTRAGAERLIEWSNTVLRDESGQVIGTFSSGTDITERRAANDAQRASEGRYRALFDYAPDGIVIADRDSYYLDANASMCHMLGYSHQELVGLHASDIVTAPEVAHIGPALRAITSRSDYRREWEFRRKDGSVFAADVMSTEMPDGNLLAMIRDVSERNDAVAALRTTEERMRYALQNANIGIWDMDYVTGDLRWSSTIEAHYGLSPGTFGGTAKAFVERIHPDDRDASLETIDAAVKAGRDFTIEHRTIWPDGTVRWLNGVGRTLLDEHGQPVRGLGISQDITERKHAESILRQSETRKAAILDSVLDCIVTMDASGKVIEFNAAAERTFGFTRAEVMGRALADVIIPPALRAAHTAGLARYLATAEGPLLGRLVEVTAMRSDGVEFPVELAISVIRTDQTPMFTGVLRDLSARKQADQTRARLAAIVDCSDDAIFSMALDGTILTWNHGAERLYGYTAHDMIGRDRALLVPPEKQAELTAIMERAARGDAGEPVETHRTRKDGSTVEISLTISPMTDLGGRVTGVSTIARDITTRKRAEAELFRLNGEIQLQRLRVFRATIRTVEDIVNNLLNGLQLVHLDGEDLASAEIQTLVGRLIQEATEKLTMLANLETVQEKEMEIGLGIDYPGGSS